MPSDRELTGVRRQRGRRRGALTRRSVSFAIALLAALLVAVPATASWPTFPASIPLPNGFYPEGVAVGTGNDFYVGSLLDGAVYAGDLRSGTGEILAEGTEGRVVVGLSFDARSGLLWAAGVEGGSGAALAFDTDTGELVHAVPVPGAQFLNDIVVTRHALYLTDSFSDQLWTVPLDRRGSPAGGARALPLSGDFEFVTTGELPLNLNGIDATANGQTLIAVHTSLGLLYRIDPVTGVATEIDLRGAGVPTGDGILLHGRTLYVVQNFLNQVAVLQLSPDLGSGELVDELTSELFRIPTTVARAGNRLVLVNARFDVAFPPSFGGEPVSIDYDVVQLRR
jgi:sugar lactone lactonase YvrE